MWEHDWALLGIAPTTELAAIKKAYALKLKTTRPDDDAEAYQALRAAYERVQQWARWQRENPESAGAPVDVPDKPTPAAEAVPAGSSQEDLLPAQAPDDDAPPPAAESAQVTVQELHAQWQQHGGPALTAQWPSVYHLLEAQPLARRAEWSAHFAHWVAQHDALPDAFVYALNDYFDWQGDFRVERQIGAQLAQAVQHAVRERQQQAATPSEEQQTLVRPLRQLDKLRGRQGWALGLAALLEPALSQLLNGLHPRTLGQCGIDLLMRRSLEKQLWAGRLLRVGLLCGLVFMMFLLAPGGSELALTRMGAWCALGIAWLGASHYVGLFMHFGVSLQRSGRTAIAMPVQRWRQHRWQPGAGLGLLAATAVLAAFSASWDVTTTALPIPDHMKALLQMVLAGAPWILLWLGASLAWPVNPASSAVCAGLLVPACALLFQWASPDDPWAAVVAVGTLYVLVGAARAEERLPGNFILDTACRPVLNTLVLAQRWGWQFALLPSLVALAFGFSSRPPPSASSLVLAWVAATLALHQLQHRGERWAWERLNRA